MFTEDNNLLLFISVLIYHVYLSPEKDEIQIVDQFCKQAQKKQYETSIIKCMCHIRTHLSPEKKKSSSWSVRQAGK